MSLFVALSCLQGRPMQSAFDELAELGCGVQLTPGNFPPLLVTTNVETRSHHGFCLTATKQDVWDAEGNCLVASDSVHPPLRAKYDARAEWLERSTHPLLETMYPGYVLGTGAEIDDAITRGLPLAVDVSHVFIQRTQGVMTDATWQRLARYERILEVHVSANRGVHDAHQPLTRTTFGLDWARERVPHVPVVLECYMHRLSHAERQAQIELVSS